MRKGLAQILDGKEKRDPQMLEKNKTLGKLEKDRNSLI